MICCILFLLLLPSLLLSSPYFIDQEELPEYKNRPSIAYVKKNYEHTMHGIDYLCYPAEHPKRLWVLFNGATVNRYTMWSWFWNEHESWEDTSFLFLKDDAIRWYLGTEKQPLTQAYCDIITHVAKASRLTMQDTYTIGHSMGGYAALYFGLLLNVQGIFALRPQIDWYHGTQFFSIKKLKNLWVNIDELILQTKKIPSIYLQFGEFGPDRGAGKACLHALLEKRSFTIVEKTRNTTHTGYHPTKEYIEQTLHYFEKRKSCLRKR